MEKSWNCVFEFLWEPCKNPIQTFGNLNHFTLQVSIVKTLMLICRVCLLLIFADPTNDFSRQPFRRENRNDFFYLCVFVCILTKF